MQRQKNGMCIRIRLAFLAPINWIFLQGFIMRYRVNHANPLKYLHKFVVKAKTTYKIKKSVLSIMSELIKWIRYILRESKEILELTVNCKFFFYWDNGDSIKKKHFVVINWKLMKLTIFFHKYLIYSSCCMNICRVNYTSRTDLCKQFDFVNCGENSDTSSGIICHTICLLHGGAI